MARIPFGPWQPSTSAQDETATDFENPAFQAEVQRDTEQWVQGIAQLQPYEVDGRPETLESKVVRGLLDAEVE